MTGMWLLPVLLVLIGCGGPAPCPGPLPECPYYVTLTVSTPDGGAARGVQATISGAALSCTPTATGASCSGSPVLPGPLQVTAPGFQPIDVNAIGMTTPAPRCGCGGFTLEPSNVTLSMVMRDGGVDAPTEVDIESPVADEGGTDLVSGGDTRVDSDAD